MQLPDFKVNKAVRSPATLPSHRAPQCVRRPWLCKTRKDLRSTCCGKPQIRSPYAGSCPTARNELAGADFQTQAAWHHRQDRADCRHDHLHHHGVHHFRQPEHHGRCRDQPWCGVRCHLHRRRPGLPVDGPVRQLAGRPGTGHGPQCILYLHGRRHHGLHLGSGLGGGVRFRRAVHAADLVTRARVAAQQYPGQPAPLHGCRGRAVSRVDRPENRRHCRRQPCHPDQARLAARTRPPCWPQCAS